MLEVLKMTDYPSLSSDKEAGYSLRKDTIMATKIIFNQEICN